MRALLTLDQLTIERGGRRLLSGLNLEIKAGQRWAILGPSGAGKSSLLAVMAGLTGPSSGTRLLLDRARHSAREQARLVGLMAQQGSADWQETVLEATLAGRHPYRAGWGWEDAHDRELAMAALRALAMDALANRSVATLSGGERQRVALATLLTQAPALRLADEPVSQLDPGHAEPALRALTDISKQQALVIVVHDPAQAARHCDHVLLMHGDGRWQSGTRDQLLTAEALSELYGLPLQMLGCGRSRSFVPTTAD